VRANIKICMIVTGLGLQRPSTQNSRANKRSLDWLPLMGTELGERPTKRAALSKRVE